MTLSGRSQPEPLRTIQHQVGSYPVYLHAGIRQSIMMIAGDTLPHRRLVVIVDEAVTHYAPDDVACITVPAGEGSKTRAQWAAVSDTMLRQGLGRDSGIIALGGGVVGDLAGFVAATYHRGIPYLQVPTTLLAMIDASIGGKTAVDTPEGKNLIGAFHPPAAVIIDPETLATLPERHLRAGLAEAIKHGCIRDREYFETIDRQMAPILARDPEALIELIGGSLRIKAAVVEADEHETGLRAILNAGHTIGHAVEVLSQWTLLHGEAISLGLMLETRLAEQIGVAKPGVSESIRSLLDRAALPTTLPPSLNHPTRLMDVMERDKKNRAGEIRFSFIRSVGSVDDGENGSMTRAVSRETIGAFLSSVDQDLKR